MRPALVIAHALALAVLVPPAGPIFQISLWLPASAGSSAPAAAFRPTLEATVSISSALQAPPGAQEKPGQAPVPSKKGDRIAIYGCLRGSSLEASDLGGSSEDVLPVTQGLTFRLTGDKKLLKEMKEKHEKTLVELHGTLKSDLEPSDGPTGKLGRMRIGIGAPPTGSATAADEARRPVPVVEVTSYTGRGTTCGR